MEITLNFEKNKISRNVCTFIELNIKGDEEKRSLQRIVKGNKVQYKEANNLLHAIISAISINDDEEDVTIKKIPDPDDLDETAVDVSTQAKKENTISPGIEGSSKDLLPEPVITETAKSSDPKITVNDKKPLCKFFRNGKCKRGKECCFDHPPICNKFRQFGTKNLDDKGCDEKCNQYHPNACRDSLKNRTCSRTDCLFYHLKGTKLVERSNQI